MREDVVALLMPRVLLAPPLHELQQLIDLRVDHTEPLQHHVELLVHRGEAVRALEHLLHIEPRVDRDPQHQRVERSLDLVLDQLGFLEVGPGGPEVVGAPRPPLTAVAPRHHKIVHLLDRCPGRLQQAFHPVVDLGVLFGQPRKRAHHPEAPHGEPPALLIRVVEVISVLLQAVQQLAHLPHEGNSLPGGKQPFQRNRPHAAQERARQDAPAQRSRRAREERFSVPAPRPGARQHQPVVCVCVCIPIPLAPTLAPADLHPHPHPDEQREHSRGAGDAGDESRARPGLGGGGVCGRLGGSRVARLGGSRVARGRGIIVSTVGGRGSHCPRRYRHDGDARGRERGVEVLGRGGSGHGRGHVLWNRDSRRHNKGRSEEPPPRELLRD
ncbi:hypothetical protein T484DRAFT_1989252 [Baffinella frigidus]|nr:hypothetical protein T484DRAFT_1989264 [Cryptophyta sp. CCMP2293]KAJ1465197.1 hypothetical protein T484DRAFT_1989252 [Cryptophyta sp. CCMP2293]